MNFFFQEKLFLNYNKLSVAEYRKNNKKNDKILINIFGRGRHLCNVTTLVFAEPFSMKKNSKITE